MRLLVGVLLLVSGTAVWGSEGMPVTVRPTELKDLNAETWSAEAKDGEHTFRSALKGKASTFRIPAWWGDGVRPAEGKKFTLEITFKDDLTSPAVVECFGALGVYLNRSELHRFGGEADGAWKVAQAPLSWDMIRVLKDTHEAEFAFRAPADLAIEKIVIRDAKLPDDQDRWEAETRAWVKKAQAEKAKTAVQANPDQTPEIPEAWKDKPFVPYARAYYDNVNQNSAPKGKEAGAAVIVRMARNEYEPATFGIFAQQDLEGLTYSVSELKGEAGTLACEIQCRAAEYALLPKGKDAWTWSPQRLWKAFPQSIKKGQSGWGYVTIKTLGEASAPGKYEGTITVKGDGKEASIPLKVEVLPITLLTMDEAGLRMGGCCTGLASVTEMREMLNHNHNAINIWFAGVQPGMEKKDGKLVLDFTYLDDWMAQAKACGQKTMVWFLGGNPNGYPETLSIERDLYGAMIGPKNEYMAKMATPEQRGKIMPEVAELYKEWIRQVSAHAKEKGWPELIFTPFDEPAKWSYAEPKAEPNRKFAIGCGPWIRDHFKAACALIHEAAPDNKVYISMHRNYVRNVHGYNGRVGEIFIPDVDLVCTNAIDEDYELGDKVRKAGKLFWQYGGGGSRRYGYGFYFAAWDSRGSLCWAYNWGKRFEVSEGSNWQYAWYSPYETVLTPNYEEIREAWDDRRYLETAKALAQKKGADIAPQIEQIRKETLDDRGQGGRDLVNDFWEEGREASKMDYWRKLLADKIIELSK